MCFALARITAGGTPIDLLLSLLRFQALLDLVGMSEVCELEQRLAEA